MEHGLYAREAQILIQQIMNEKETAEMHVLLARALAMQKSFAKAVVEVRVALAWSYEDEKKVQEIYALGKEIASNIKEQPIMTVHLDQDIIYARKRRETPEDASLEEICDTSGAA